MRTASYLDPRRRERCTECGTGLDLCQCEDPDALAHDRCTSAQGKFLLDASRHPVPDNRLFEALVGTLGVIARDLVEHDAVRTPAPDAIYKNLVYLAAVAAKLATDGTPEYAFPEA